MNDHNKKTFQYRNYLPINTTTHSHAEQPTLSQVMKLQNVSLLPSLSCSRTKPFIRQQKLYQDVSTQTTFDMFDNIKCLSIPNDLHGWSYSKLSKLSCNDLYLMCQKRHIDIESSVKHHHIHSLIDWKQTQNQIKVNHQQFKRSSLHIPDKPNDQWFKTRELKLDISSDSDDPIVVKQDSDLDSDDQQPIDMFHSDENTPIFEVEQLFFDDLSLNEKQPKAPMILKQSKFDRLR